jgi:hypothetical protein
MLPVSLGCPFFLLPLGCFLMFICSSSLCCYFLWMCLTRRESVQVLYCLLGQCRFKTWKEGWNLYLNSDDIFVLDLDFQQYLSSCFYCVVGCQLLLFLTFSYYSLIIFHSDLGPSCNQSLPPPKLWVFKSHSWQGVLDTILCDEVCQWLAAGLWFSICTPFSSTNKTDRHDITEILLKVPLNSGTITLTSSFWLVMSMDFIICNLPYLLSLRFEHLLHVFRTWNVQTFKPLLAVVLTDLMMIEKNEICFS